MKSRTKIVTGVLALAGAILFGLLCWALTPSCPLAITMVSVKHRYMTNNGVARAYSVIHLRVKNRENVLVLGRVVQPSKVQADGRWDETFLVNVSATIAPGQEAPYIIFARGSPDRCALQVEYERGTWRTRLWGWLGTRGQHRIQKLPFLEKWINPAHTGWFPKSDDWQRATLETDLPTTGANAVGGAQTR